MLFDHPEFDGHTRVVWLNDPATGLRAIHAVHRPIGGRAGGGVRFRADRTELEALTDVLRLSRGMTYKMVLAGLPLGGAKTVIIGDPAELKTPELLAAFGRYVESLDGLYVAGPDVGTNAADMAELARTTRFVAGRADQSGSTALPTALGVFEAIRATAEAAFGNPDLAGRHVAIQGVGGVGGHLVRMLIEAGARVSAADPDPSARDAAAALGAQVVAPDAILETEADILSPCALGGVLDPETIGALQVRAVCGAANNQLATPDCARLLAERGIVWAPDYVASAGGAIDGCKDAGLITPTERDAKLKEIGDTLRAVFARAERDGTTQDAAAQTIARERVAEIA